MYIHGKTVYKGKKNGLNTMICIRKFSEIPEPFQTSTLLDVSLQQLTSLEGCPEKIFSNFDCSHNYLSSFRHFPRYVQQSVRISHNEFTSFKDIDQHIEHIDNELGAMGMDITSGFSDLFGINGLHKILIYNIEIQNIVNKW